MEPLLNLPLLSSNKSHLGIRCAIVTFTISIFAILSLNAFDYDFEDTPSNEEKPLFVSLGSGCDQGITLRECGLRYAAFPFDWLICGNHKKFITLLEDDFAFFTDENYFVPYAMFPGFPNLVMNYYYDLIFRHEGTVTYEWSELDKYQAQLALIKEKYTRRINRFRELRQHPGKIFFIRNFTWDEEGQIAHNNEQALELKEALERYFPLVNFTLIVVTYKDTLALPLKPIDKVIEFQLDRPPWREEYRKMYETLLNHHCQAP